MAEKKKTGAVKRTSARSSNVGKKSGSAATTAARPSAKKTRGAEIKGIILIALGLFLVVSLYFDVTGVVGQWFKQVVLGMFGGPAMIFFVLVIWVGIDMFIEKKSEKATYKMWLLLILMAFISVMWAAFLDGDEWNYDSFFNAVKSMYSYGVGGGGVVGGLICAGLSKLIGVVGTIIISVAVIMILFVILTEVSIERMFRRIGAYIKKNRDNIATDLDEEIDMEVDNIKPRRKRDKRGLKHKPVQDDKAAVETVVEDDKQPDRAPNSDYFDVYFKEGDVESIARGGEVPLTIKKRFTFDDEDVFEETAEGVAEEVLEEHRRRTAEEGERKPFKIEDIATGGVLTELPDENGNIPKSGDGEFEPPTQAQIEDRVDVFTQEAIDAGVSLDRVVETGRRLNQQEVQQATDSVGAMARESIEATRILNYKLPLVSLLAKPKPKTKSRAEEKRELEDKANRLLETLESFKVDAKILNITQGPTVTRFELQPGFGIKVSKITNLADDIALSLAASGVRIEAPIPGKSAIGIEIPNQTPSPVPIREVIDTDKFREFKSKTAFALGKDISGNCVIADIAQFPHILIAGATGSGKSVCINSLITSILYKAKPNEVKMIMIDPKMVELGVYNGIPHLLIPVVTDPKHAAGALNWAVAEMKNRYQLMKDNKVRNLQGFNELMEENETPERKLPEIVIIIDELADLMLAAKSEVEDAINSLAALARAAGMYLVIATQRPSVDVITGVIKANVPSRISFAVSSQIDSRTILDTMGAEKLLGKGDMLYAPRGAVKPIRIQGNFLSDDEIEDIIAFIKKQYEAEYDESIIEHIEREQEMSSDEDDEDNDHTRSGDKDALFFKAAELVFESGQASVAMLQRRYKIGYQRAARIIDQLEENRIIGPYEGTKPRQVLISRAELNEMMMNNSN